MEQQTGQHQEIMKAMTTQREILSMLNLRHGGGVCVSRRYSFELDASLNRGPLPLSHGLRLSGGSLPPEITSPKNWDQALPPPHNGVS